MGGKKRSPPLELQRGRLCSRLRGNGLQGTHGGLDVVDVELTEQLHRATADVLAEALVLRLASGGQIEVGAAYYEAVALKAGEQRFGGLGIEAGPLEQPDEVGPGEGRPASGEQAKAIPRLGNGVTLGEVLAQDAGEGALGEARAWPNWP